MSQASNDGATAMGAGAGPAPWPAQVQTQSDEELYFAEDLTYLLRDRAVAALGPASRRQVSIYALYDHLRFTVALELGPVSQVCLQLHRGDLLRLDGAQRHQALCIYADEAKHAVLSESLLRRVMDQTRVPSFTGEPSFLRELSVECEGSDADLVRLLFVIVSETLITGTLRSGKNDSRIFEPVRTYAGLHAADEAGHRVYFSGLLRQLWAELTRTERRTFGVQIPRLLALYLEPDLTSWSWALRSLGFADPAAQAARIAQHPWVRQSIRRAASSTVRAVARLGLLEDELIKAAFVDQGLG